MPPLTDPSLIQERLDTDCPWAAYALADLEPPLAEHASWFAAAGSPAIGLLYRGFSTPVLIGVGEAEDFRPVLDEMDAALGETPEVYLSVRPDGFRLIAG